MAIFETPVNSPMGFIITSAMLPRNREWTRKFGTTLKVYTESMRDARLTTRPSSYEHEIDTYTFKHEVEVITPYGARRFIVSQQQILECIRAVIARKGFVMEEQHEVH